MRITHPGDPGPERDEKQLPRGLHQSFREQFHQLAKDHSHQAKGHQLFEQVPDTLVEQRT